MVGASEPQRDCEQRPDHTGMDSQSVMMGRRFGEDIPYR